MDKNELSEEASYAADLMRTADKARDRAHAWRHDADGRIRSTAEILRPVVHFFAAEASSYIRDRYGASTPSWTCDLVVPSFTNRHGSSCSTPLRGAIWSHSSSISMDG